MENLLKYQNLAAKTNIKRKTSEAAVMGKSKRQQKFADSSSISSLENQL